MMSQLLPYLTRPSLTCPLTLKNGYQSYFVRSASHRWQPSFARQRVRNLSSSVPHWARKYTRTHEWITMDGGEFHTVGLTDYCQDSLGDIVYVEMPEISTVVAKGEEIGVVESVKAASEIYSPVSGTVVEINKSLEESPGLINTRPFDEGWIFKILPKGKLEFDKLLDEEAYVKFIEDEHPL